MSLIHNAKEFLLRTEKQTEPVMGARFLQRKLIADEGRTMVLNARILDLSTRVETPFRLWYEAGQEHLSPLRFEYQANPWLRLGFEFDPHAAPPVITPVLKQKEDL